MHIISGPLNGSSFIEDYEKMPSGTKLIINVHIKFNGFLKIFSPLRILLKSQMSKVMNEFLNSAEKYILDSNQKNN